MSTWTLRLVVVLALAASAVGSGVRPADGRGAGEDSGSTAAPGEPMPGAEPAQSPPTGLPDRFQFSVGPDTPATGPLGTIRSVAVSPDGTIYAVRSGSTPAVFRFSARGELINAWGSLGDGPGEIGRGGPADVAVGPDRTVYVTDPGNSRVQRYTAWGAYLGQWGSQGRGAGQFDHACNPYCVGFTPTCASGGIAVAPDGTVYVADSCAGRVQHFGATGHYLGEWASVAPHDVAVGPDGRVYVAEYVGHIAVFDAAGRRLGEIGKPGWGEAGAFQKCRVVNECGVAYAYPCGPEGIAVGPDGTVYATDRNNPRVTRFTPDGAFIDVFGATPSEPTGPPDLETPIGIAVAQDGTVYTSRVSGGLQAFEPDGTFVGHWHRAGPVHLPFDTPVGVAPAADGGFYVVDTGNNRVARVDADGNVVGEFGAHGPVAAHLASPLGVAVAADGSVWVADSGNHRLAHYDAGGGYLGSWGRRGAGAVDLRAPADVAVGARGRLYVADSETRRVTCVDADGAVCGYLVSPTLPGRESRPTGVTVAPDGSVYVADCWLGRVVVFAPDGSLHRSWDVGAYPFDVALAADGTVFVTHTDRSGESVTRYTATGDPIDLLVRHGCGDGESEGAQGVAVLPDGSIVVADTGNHRLLRLSGEGVPLADPAAEPVLDARLRSPSAIAASPDGTAYVLDSGNSRVVRLSAHGEVLGVFGRTGCGPGGLGWATALTVAPWGEVLVIDGRRGEMMRFAPDGAYVGSKGVGADARHDKVYRRGIAAAIEPDGRRVIYVSDATESVIRKMSPFDDRVTVLGTGRLSLPQGLALAPDGSLYVADYGLQAIVHFTRDGQPAGRLDPGGSWHPQDVAVDADGRVLGAGIGDRIHVFAASDAYLGAWPAPTRFPGGQLANPAGIAVAPDGTVWVADADANRVIAYAAAPAPFWHARFYADRGLLDGPVSTTTAPLVDFDWGLLAPAPYLPVDGFSTRIERLSDLPSGTYMLRLTTHGGATLSAGDHPAVVASGHPGIASAAMRLRTGEDMLRIDYSDTGGRAAVRLDIAPAIATLFMPLAHAGR
jgi:tripartite motif-containing protein 71